MQVDLEALGVEEGGYLLIKRALRLKTIAEAEAETRPATGGGLGPTFTGFEVERRIVAAPVGVEDHADRPARLDERERRDEIEPKELRLGVAEPDHRCGVERIVGRAFFAFVFWPFDSSFADRLRFIH